jgi:hypothetical protein
MSYMPTVSASSAAAAASINSAAAAAAYFNRANGYPTPSMHSSALSFGGPQGQNFLPASMGYIGGSLADCSAPGLPWNSGPPPRLVG